MHVVIVCWVETILRGYPSPIRRIYSAITVIGYFFSDKDCETTQNYKTNHTLERSHCQGWTRYRVGLPCNTFLCQDPQDSLIPFSLSCSANAISVIRLACDPCPADMKEIQISYHFDVTNIRRYPLSTHLQVGEFNCHISQSSRLKDVIVAVVTFGPLGHHHGWHTVSLTSIGSTIRNIWAAK